MPGAMRTPFLPLLLIVSLFGSAGITCPEGDLSGNCRVDWEDLQLLADRWLDYSCSAPECEADLDGVPGVTGSKSTTTAITPSIWQECT